MQCAAFGMSTDRLTPPHPFNLCSNADSTHTSISQRQPLDMTMSTCTQPPCSSVSRSWQSSYSLGQWSASRGSRATCGSLHTLWPRPSLCRAKLIFFRSSESSLPFAMLNFQ
ncbi:unnamed protein product [Staurois parvus]|uniref:Uncharacterized protein n=1 Tax=Staurois parvus TaxID=386267 RepID=A0ABN9CHB8_9NEOB|nr:unnamed protein product [Staurois parvus]